MKQISKLLLPLAAALLAPASFVAAAPAASAATGVTATFTKTQDWGTGYQATYTITNTGPAALSSWTITFGLPAGQQMGTFWDATQTASANPVTFVNRAYNGTVPAGGGTVTFGFVVSYSGTFAPPVNCTVNGGACGGGPGPSPSPTPTPSPSPSPSPGPGGGTGSAVAPYVDLTNNQEGMLDQAAGAGLKAFTAAFVIGSGCTPIWGDTLPVTSDPAVTADITRAESEGAQPVISFGGAAGIELAQSCPNLSQLVAAYQSVISTLHATRLDFDIEGAAIADTATNNLRFQAINQLEASNPGLSVSVTIPTFPTGPDANGQAFLRQAATDGTHLSVVNVMAMDYYAGFDGTGTSMGSYAVEAAQDTLAFLKTVFPSATYAMVGVTPMIGQNDDPAEVFTEADAHTLVSFAERSHLGRLAFWSVDRDQPCSASAGSLSQCSQISQQSLDFTKTFDQYTG
jgi:cellulose binding protein with CBM2 domain